MKNEIERQKAERRGTTDFTDFTDSIFSPRSSQRGLWPQPKSVSRKGAKTQRK